MSKKIFVLFVAVVFLSSIISILIKDTKKIHEDRRLIQQQEKLYEEEITQENFN